ncbi:hypothetical protein BaRGS_00028980 [Batillaria attramentaria]|uniref:Uncharacterized protein n=1 Tax=Batillaria attramentaria TaxID=370345 RepID=A0ABD0JYZ3_9CAEN
MNDGLSVITASVSAETDFYIKTRNCRSNLPGIPGGLVDPGLAHLKIATLQNCWLGLRLATKAGQSAVYKTRGSENREGGKKSVASPERYLKQKMPLIQSGKVAKRKPKGIEIRDYRREQKAHTQKTRYRERTSREPPKLPKPVIVKADYVVGKLVRQVRKPAKESQCSVALHCMQTWHQLPSVLVGEEHQTDRVEVTPGEGLTDRGVKVR